MTKTLLQEEKQITDTLQPLAHLVDKSMKGNNHIIPHIQQYVCENIQLYDIAQNFSSRVLQAQLNYMAQGDTSKMTELEREAELFRQHLSRENQSALEELVLHEVVVSFIMLRCCDEFLYRHRSHINSIDLRYADMLDARLARNIRLLERLRNSKITLQFNVGKNQKISCT